MEPPHKEQQIVLYSAWYKDLLEKLHRLAQPCGEAIADYTNVRLRSYAEEVRGEMSPQRLNGWDERRLETLYAQFTYLAEQTFFRRFDATVPYDHLIDVSVSESHCSDNKIFVLF